MEPEIVRNWLAAINLMISTGLWVFMFFDRRHHATIGSIERIERKLDDKIDTFRDRIAQVEGEIKTAPRREELVRLHERIDDVFNNIQTTQLMIGELSGQIKQMSQVIHHES